MAVITNLSGLNIQTQKNNFFNVFSFIRQNTDQILGEDADACLSENPFVDIETIAKNVGITDIQRVRPKDVDYKHARLKNKIILVNEKDAIEEQRFSIAHEIYHFMCKKEAARSGAILEFEIWKNHEETADEFMKKIATDASKELGKHISESIGKAISEKTEKIVFEKIGKNVSKIMAKNIVKERNAISEKTAFSICNKIVKSIIEIINETIDEEIADYFAANLIVPVERFILWEDKQDEEIARAFGVTEDCIKKRREEIENELHFMVPKKLSSGIKIEETVLLSHDEMDRILESYGSNVAGRG